MGGNFLVCKPGARMTAMMAEVIIKLTCSVAAIPSGPQLRSVYFRPRHRTESSAFSLWPMVAIGELKWVSHNTILLHWVDLLGTQASKLASRSP